jgi:hypothetical protein
MGAWVWGRNPRISGTCSFFAEGKRLPRGVDVFTAGKRLYWGKVDFSFFWENQMS